MKLLTKELLRRFEKVGRQPVQQDPLMIAKFFNPAIVKQSPWILMKKEA